MRTSDIGMLTAALVAAGSLGGPYARSMLAGLQMPRGKRWQCCKCGKLQRKDPMPEQRAGWDRVDGVWTCPKCGPQKAKTEVGS